MNKENIIWAVIDMYDLIKMFPEIKQKTDIHLMPEYITYNRNTHLIWFAFNKKTNWSEIQEQTRKILKGESHE